MAKKRFTEIPLDQRASYKQQWAVAYRFAKECADKFPDKSEKGLAVIFNAVIHRYHAEHGNQLTHGDVQKYLGGKKQCPSYYVDLINIDTEEQESAEQVEERDIADVLIGSNLGFEYCLRGLDKEHARKLNWFYKNKGKSFTWADLVPEYANSYKGIFKPKDLDYALSVRTQKRSSYKDGEFEYYPNDSWILEYDLESNDQSVSNKVLWTNQALLNCAKGFVPIGIIEQIKGKPDAVYRVHGPGLVKVISDTNVRIFGFNNDGVISKNLYEI